LSLGGRLTREACRIAGGLPSWEDPVSKSLWFAVVGAFLIVGVAVSQSEVTADSAPPEEAPLPEPTDDVPPPGAPKPFDPLTSHSPGRAESLWQYEDLSPEEQESADRGFDSTAWAAGQQALAAAAMEKAPAMAAKRAQLMMGITDLANTGVVP